ncbi:hypothetical protein LA303_05880 [Candidatus Sulfidibacterium hydrothermale]|uniref:hypothetical protein n=1 Tax=Candidatus Sulfidibacterium hydrothermale TaxID=2875962 RepID=UPI001F0A9FC9|nr:hypothetical protein [Candidatus Sulfidibacterium hydrothermale]UBM63495.1 hypothetical protein LA303_05880 [Candidatus Sulfidibacterium hydrothermale]
MKTKTALLTTLFTALMLLGSYTLKAQSSDTLRSQKTMHKTHVFIDKDGDGYNDNAPDDDGDGIPNSLDPDWYKKKNHKASVPYIDENGDGINDYLEGDNHTPMTGNQKKNELKLNSPGEMDKTGSSINTKMSTTKNHIKKGGGKR